MSLGRREFLRRTAGASAAVAAAGSAAVAAGCRSEADEAGPRWDLEAIRKPDESRVAVLDAAAYDGTLVDTVRRGIQLFELAIRGKRIVLKPNLVEFDPNGVINTHPALIAATIEVLRSMDARGVVVAEGPGHRRDNEYVLVQSGLFDVLRDTGTTYVDLNSDSVSPRRVPARFSGLGTLYLPDTVLEAELFISMPKLKTHHWAGVTLSMKNMFGIMPSSIYGWPKNVLHWAGIENCILDINATLDVPRFNIVDGIVGMEGNGPIQGDARNVGVLVMGQDPVAVDSTCARLMRIEPWEVSYLQTASAFLGNLRRERILQLAEDPEPRAQDFAVLPGFAPLKVTAAG
ncbi:MAG: DUF362 domain-containing protein [Gemmatimonadota bacterium]